MKIALKDLKDNPYRKKIGEGTYNMEQIEKIYSTLEDVGMIGSLPAYKNSKTGNYHLIFGHHRRQALVKKFGRNFQIEVTVHKNYDDNQIFKGLIIENLTHRKGEFHQETENLQAIKDYLEANPEILERVRTDSVRTGKLLSAESYKNKATAQDIAEWLDKASGMVIAKTTIVELIRVVENLDEEIIEEVEEQRRGKKDEETDEVEEIKPKKEKKEEGINKTQAILLSGFPDKSEQKKLLKVIKNTREQRVRQQTNLLTVYKKAPEHLKEDVLKFRIDLADLPAEVKRYEASERQKKLKEAKDKQKFKVIELKKAMRQINIASTQVSKNQNTFIYVLQKLHKKGILKELDFGEMETALHSLINQTESFLVDLKKIYNNI